MYIFVNHHVVNYITLKNLLFVKEGNSIVNVDIFNQIKNLNIKTLNITYINLNKKIKR